ncbi:MAG: mycofactocin biosynthesis glycosyltransferase MftF [Nocardioides sp.]|uniref:mycofactocin biosynthesis glycosyltransferase MftF n=1 Tax=Nocardioides sp. TaxID=35761 RepID=UPI0032657CD8
MNQPLPEGFRVILDPKALRTDAGRLLIGGSPITAMRLAPATAAHLVDGRVIVTDAVSAQLADRLVATNIAYPDVRSMAPAGPDEITVVVPVRDRPGQLDQCLAALAPLAVVVVDDASLDPAAVATVARQHGARLIRLTENLGPAGARNAGLAEVTTNLVAFVDSDVEVYANDLMGLTRHFADPAVALVGPRIMGRTRSKRPKWFEEYDAASSSLSLGRAPSTVRPGAAVAWLPSACLVARTSVLESGFDASLRVGEDVDLVWRLAAAGHRVRYDPDVVAGHDVRTSVGGWLGRKFVYGTGGALLAQRHGAHIAPAVLSPSMAVAGIALLVRRRWSAPVALVGLVAATRTVQRSLPQTVDRHTRMRVAAGLSARGLGWAIRQESALLLRHWWPLTLLGIWSRHVRRAVATALVLDAYLALVEVTPTGPSLPVRLVGRRLDDLAYGSGLWWGALRARSTVALGPRRPGRPDKAPRDTSPLTTRP